MKNAMCFTQHARNLSQRLEVGRCALFTYCAIPMPIFLRKSPQRAAVSRCAYFSCIGVTL